jgi:hypothetical protein
VFCHCRIVLLKTQWTESRKSFLKHPEMLSGKVLQARASDGGFGSARRRRFRTQLCRCFALTLRDFFVPSEELKRNRNNVEQTLATLQALVGESFLGVAARERAEPADVLFRVFDRLTSLSYERSFQRCLPMLLREFLRVESL